MVLTFATTNGHKLLAAKHVCAQFGIDITPKRLKLQEIQSTSGEEIALYKARQAFEKLKRPVVVTDDLWSIEGLNGFPGPYMKQMNQWLTPADVMRLIAPLSDRQVILHNYLCYQDQHQTKVFHVAIQGTLLGEVRGKSKYPIFTIVSFDGGQHSAAEANRSGQTALKQRHTAWHELCQWLKQSPNG